MGRHLTRIKKFLTRHFISALLGNLISRFMLHPTRSSILLLAFFWSCCTLQAQKLTTVDTSLRSFIRMELSFQGLGLGYEQRLGKHTTVDFAAGHGGAYWVEPGSLTYSLGFLTPAFYASVTPKWYFNRAKRQRKGKTLAWNAGNYLGLRTKFVTASTDNTDPTFPTLLMNLHWGLQRPLGGRWLFQTHAGVGLASNLTFPAKMIYPALDFKFAYSF
jgi:hypothetical protein